MPLPCPYRTEIKSAILLDVANVALTGHAPKGRRMVKLAVVVTILTLLAALVGLSPCARASGISDSARFVPQLELTDLDPVKVALAPDDDTLLLVVNGNGRVDVFDISNPGTPVKITEIQTSATDAVFAPTRTKREKIGIVSAGEDGTVRLWTLDGKPAAEPFKGHDGLVWSVAFSADGTRIVSAGGDGTVRLWTLDGKPAAEPMARASSPPAGTASGCGTSRLGRRCWLIPAGRWTPWALSMRSFSGSSVLIAFALATAHPTPPYASN